MSSHPPSPSNPFLNASSAPPPAPSGGMRQPPMQQQPSLLLMPPSQPMVQNLSMIGMGRSTHLLVSSPYGRKLRCMTIGDIVCSALIICGSIFAVVVGLAEMEIFAEFLQLGQAFLYCTAAFGFVGMLLYGVNIFFACVIFSATSSALGGSISRTLGWMVTQAAGLVYSVALLAFMCAYKQLLWGVTYLIPITLHCMGIVLAFQFRKELQSSAVGVAPMMTPAGGGTPPFSGVVVTVTQADEGSSLDGQGITIN